MKSTISKRSQVLSEANQLVSNGMRQAAIDLLEEYLESDPGSSTVLQLLGKAYIINQQHMKAVECLRRAKVAEQEECAPATEKTEYQSNSFNEEDMIFIDEQESIGAEKQYMIDDEFEAVKPLTTARTGQEQETDVTPVQVLASKTETEQEQKPQSEQITDTTTTKQVDWLEELVCEEIEEESPPVEETLFGKCITEDLEPEGEDEFDDMLLPTTLASSEEELGEQSWDDLDIIDELGEFNDTNQQLFDTVEACGAVSREERAQQIAIEVLDKFEWSNRHLPLLQKIFIENGWSAARVSIEREIENGVLPEELALARKVRIYWTVYSKFWITFHKVGRGHTYYRQADAAYRIMSWPEAVTIVRCFHTLPDIEEVYALIDDAYEIWYSSKRLRKSFHAFFKFLKYRTGSMDRTLPGDCPFYFHGIVDPDGDIDSRLLNPLSPESNELLDLGFSLNQWPRPSEIIMNISTEWLL